MITPGKYNSLEVNDVLPMGLMAISLDDEAVFIPYQQDRYKVGDKIDVFIYFNPEGDLEGTFHPPKITLNEFASLRVISIIKAGAFLDWGLKPDLFLPTRLMHSDINENMPVVVRLVSNTEKHQLLADSKIEGYLSSIPEDWDKTQEVPLFIYAKTPLGYKAIVDDKYSGLLYHNELSTPLRVGQKLQGFVKQIREDGKVDLSLQLHTRAARQSLTDEILEDLKAHDGISSLTDKSPADHIYQRFKVSKGSYKKAIGSLYKAKKIIINKDYIKLVEN